MYKARVELLFEAGHRLLKSCGKCESPHGHTYKAEIILNSETLNDMDFVADFIVIKDKIGKWIDENWDHAFLINGQDNELLSALNLLKKKKVFVFNKEDPTAEVMAKYLYKEVHNLYGNMVLKVRIWESVKQYAEYSQ